MSDPADGVIPIYERHALAWSEARGKRLIEAGWLSRLRALLPRQATVLDLGCGSGEPIARYLADSGIGVIGVDGSPAMIALFRRNLPRHDAMVADMRDLALGRAFEGLIAWDSLFHLRRADQRAMFPIFAAHTLPGAPLLFTSGPEDGEAIGELEGEPLYHASLAEAEYRELLAANGFDFVAHVTRDAECAGHTVWLARRR